MNLGQMTQKIRLSVRRIFNGTTVTTARKSNAAVGKIDKEIWLNIMRIERRSGTFYNIIFSANI